MQIALDILLLVLIVSGVIATMAALYGLKGWWVTCARVAVVVCCLIFGVGGLVMACVVLHEIMQTHARGGFALLLIYLLCGLGGLYASWVFLRPRPKRQK